MLQIRDVILTTEILHEHFQCDVSKCKGLCCVHGDSGAPLEEKEVTLLKENIEQVKTYLRPEGLEAIEEQGLSVIDSDNDVVTPLINKKECAFVGFNNGIAYCCIEKAYFDGKSTFRKPVSCHLYPIRVKKYKDFSAANYDRWEICKPAIINGKRNNTKLHDFAADAIERKFGKEWLNELKIAARELGKHH